MVKIKLKIMKKTLLFLMLVAFVTISNAQPYWTSQATTFPVASSLVAQISYVDANTVWTMAQDGTGATNPIYLRQWGKSTDGGTTWTTGAITLTGVTSTNFGIGSIYGMSSTTAYVAAFPTGGSQAGGVWRTTTSGNIWQKQTTASFNTAGSFTNFVAFFNSTDGICQGDPSTSTTSTTPYFEIYTTINGGTNWTRVPKANIPAPLADEYGYVHNYAIVGNTIWFGTNKGRLFKSIDKGLNWTVVQTPLGDFGGANENGSYAFTDANNGILNDNQWGFWTTNDGGATWVEGTPLGDFRSNQICAVPGAPNTYMCTGFSQVDLFNGTSYSTDGGLNWTSLGNFIATSINFFSPTVGLAGGVTASATEGGIWKYIGTQLATVNFNDSKSISAYPNPTSGILDLAGKNISSVQVFDLLGKQISSTNYSALNNVTLNMSGLNSGVYLVKVTNDLGATSSVKVIKQ